MSETIQKNNPHTQKKVNNNPKIARRIGNKTTYTGNGGLLVGMMKGLRLHFKKYVHLLSAGPKYSGQRNNSEKE